MMHDLEIVTWVGMHEQVRTLLTGSPQMYPAALRLHPEWLRAAGAYAKAKTGEGLFEHLAHHDFEDRAQRALRFAALHADDAPLQVAINLLYRHGSDVNFNYGAMEIASRVLLDLKAENWAAPDWFWDLAVGVILEDSYILSFVADVPERLLGQMTENYVRSIPQGLAGDTLVWRKRWFDEKRERRGDDWAGVSSAHFWSLFEK